MDRAGRLSSSSSAGPPGRLVSTFSTPGIFSSDSTTRGATPEGQITCTFGPASIV